ncbi:MAG: hypothetical protein ACYSSP_11275 [Planctomycetota bacterium]
MSIANEPESLFGGKPEEQQQFVNFLIAAREHTRTITKDLPVTVTLTRAVLTGDLDNVIAECDVAYFNYYGQADPFTAPEPPSMVSRRIDELLAVARGRQLLLQEVGLPSGYEDKPSSIDSTPQMQSEFLENVFRKLKTEPRFRGACVFLMPDMSEEFCDALEQLYLDEGLPKSLTARIRESFKTTGLCRSTDGSPKPAWNTFLEGLDTIYKSKDAADSKVQAQDVETLTLQYRISMDAVAPSKFVAVYEDGMTLGLNIRWKLPTAQKQQLDALTARLEAENINGQKFTARGRWIHQGYELEVYDIEKKPKPQPSYE